MCDRGLKLLAENVTPSFTQGIASSVSQNVTGNTSALEGCHIVRFKDMKFLPWDNPDNIISAEVEDIARRVKDNLLPVIFLIGGPANIINMVVYYRQGLKERINLCLFALSLADELYLLYSMFLFGEQIYLQFITEERYGPIMRFMVNNNLVCFFGFHWVSQVLSAIIASERCLCVLSPLRFQTLLQTRTMATIITVVYLVVVGVYFLVATRYRVACVFDPPSNTARYIAIAGEFFRNHEKLINYLDSFVYGAAIPGVMISVVITTTTITAMKIREAAAWRMGASSANGPSSSSTLSSISSQELALTKMLIGISLLFIVCVSPFALLRFAWFFMPEMDVGCRHHNLYLTGLWIAEPFSLVNSSFNILVYYSMGSRYRETFWSLFRITTQDKAEEKHNEDSRYLTHTHTHTHTHTK